jgi:F0F1-type ATP synthase gamma subunit
MSNLIDTKNQLELTDSVASTVRTLEEVSVLRMQKVRGSVLETRGYLDGLLDVFKQIRDMHEREVTRILQKKTWWPDSIFNRFTPSTLSPKSNGKTLLILISPSQRLSGELIHRVFNEFAETVKKAKPETEIAIVGSVGKDLFVQKFGPTKKFTFVDWRENHSDASQLNSLLANLAEYEHLLVFTAEFQTLIQQTPRQLNLSGDQTLVTDTIATSTIPKPNQDSLKSYLCEPSLDELVAFFQNQVIAALFKQSLDESKLAHLGSRITALELATQTINDESKRLSRQVRRVKRQHLQSKQLQRLSGMGVWLTR